MILSFLFTSFFSFIVLLNTEDLFLSNYCILLNCSYSKSLMSEGLYLFFITGGDCA